ncbi:hypothetical protein G6011_06355 [Alternaria panax]|uniref:Uncharacterized protein n=1 Tax=Alternaria panax TaxID=48097 RepID=A0AAD4FG81_9PLEO|nr:hypothetical protein G6011_06355 [Alternaria panax]
MVPRQQDIGSASLGGKENVAPVILENGDMESATEEPGSLTAAEVEATKDVKRDTPCRGAGRGKKNLPAKRTSPKAATPLRRSTRAKSRKSEGFFNATQEASPDVTSTTPEAAVLLTPLHPEPSAADEEDMLQDIERLDEAHVSFNEEVPEQAVSHEQADETTAVYEATTLHKTTAIQDVEDRHAVQSPIQAFDGTNVEPVQAEAATTPIPDLTAPDALPAQAETATTSIPAPAPSNTAPITSNQPITHFEDHRAIRPGRLFTSRYAEAPTTTVAPLSGSTASDSAFAASQKSTKRRLAEDEDEGAVGYVDERSAKRTRTTNSAEPTGNRSTAVRRSYPSPWGKYEWTLTNDNRRDVLDRAIDSDLEETPARSIVDPDIVDREPVIKQEPGELFMNSQASLHSIPLTPARSNSPNIRQPSSGPNAAQPTASQAQITAIEHVDLFSLCVPRIGPNQKPLQPSKPGLKLLEDMQRKARRILSGEKDKVDIRSRLPQWMRDGQSGQQRRDLAKLQHKINAMQQKMKASQPGNKDGNVKRKAPIRHTSAPTMQNHQRTPIMTQMPSQAQPLVPKQALFPYGLEPLDYDNLSGPALVQSALEQVNNMLEIFEANVRCSLSGLDSINAQKLTGKVPSPPSLSCTSLSLSHLPCKALAGPSLMSHALQEINDMMRSFGLPRQFALCWKDLQQMQQ